MVEVLPNFITREQIESILALKDSWTPGDHRVSLPFPLNMAKGGGSTPMRYILGDTPAHKDTSATKTAFEKTFILYLHDSPGSLVIDGVPYPITAGTAYRFNEGLEHYTEGAGPRLLIGPMNEEGEAVGSINTTLAVDGALQTIHIMQDESGINYYPSDNSTPATEPPSLTLISFPLVITNSNEDPSNNILKVKFDGDLTFSSSSQYFILNSSGIQIGSEQLNEDGSLTTITVNEVENYPGLVRINSDNFGWAPVYSISIFNIKLHVDSNDQTTSLVPYGGWIAQDSFAYNGVNCRIVNCHSDGVISDYGGGIVGAYAFLIGMGLSSETPNYVPSLQIIGCSSSGALKNNAGGIVGAYSACKDDFIDLDPSFTLTVKGCWSTGSQDEFSSGGAGGIFGAYCGNSAQYGVDYYEEGFEPGNDAAKAITVVADRCYSTGVINVGGGIYGEGIFACSATNCYSEGDIAGTSGPHCCGGIIGSYSAFVTVINCYSTGTIGAGNGGIFGSNCSDITGNNLYVAGALDPSNDGVGYLFAGIAGIPDNCYSEAANESGGIWSDVHAASVLTGVFPTANPVWIVPGENQNFELFNQAASPYTLTKVNANGLISTFNMFLNPGDTSASAVVSGAPFSLIDPPARITIDVDTGAITTTAPPGDYTLIVRHSGSYYYSTVLLTVIDTCCADPELIKGIEYTTRVDVKVGDLIRKGPRFGPLSYSDLMRIRKASAFRR